MLIYYFNNQKVGGWRDFPGCPVVKNLPSNTGDLFLIPGWGTKIPHDSGQLSLLATTTEPALGNQRPLMLHRDPGAAAKTQHSQIKK